jgi:hypothetical protein
VTLAAVRRFEAAAGRAGTGREADWLDQVAADLAILEEAVKAESNEFLRVDSLLFDDARDYPRRFGSRIRQLREQNNDIAETISSLRGQHRVDAGRRDDRCPMSVGARRGSPVRSETGA